MELFKEYADVKHQIKALEEKEYALKEILLAELEPIRVAETIWGKFSTATRKSYTYSEKVTALEDKVKIVKVEEQEKGIAKLKETPYLIFTSL